MRLLRRSDTGDFSLTQFGDEAIPPYAILSHTWGADTEEVTFRDLTNGTGKDKLGYVKIRFCGEQARQDALQYFWIDTCCINKQDLNEFTTAINSMFRWYKNAVRCYVYLSDVSIGTQVGQLVHSEWDSSLRNSRWFRRGWTLQELLAPKFVNFYTRDGVQLGDKCSLEQQISEISGIPVEALHEQMMSKFSIEERFSWVEKRQTRKPEDKAYCLLGLFQVFMPLIYGEGQSSAMRRLRKEIQESTSAEPQPSVLALIQQIAPILPDDDLDKLSQLRVPGSGRWFFDSIFRNWEEGLGPPMIWNVGKSGSGKTLLFTGIVKEIQEHCFHNLNHGLGFHYCSLNRAISQRTVNILGSILAQAARLRPKIFDWIHLRKPAPGLVAQAPYTIQGLTNLLQRAMNLFDRFYLLVDALNETPWQLELLAALSHLVNICPNVRLLVTCTTPPSIYTENKIGTTVLHMKAITVDRDIAEYVRYRLRTEPAFLSLTEKTRKTIQSAVTGNSQGMFRWAQLTMDHLSTFRTGRAIREALAGMPLTLSDIYIDILDRIPTSDHQVVREALMLLCFSIRPLQLDELAEVAILQESDEDLDEDSRLSCPDILMDICQGFIEVDRGDAKLVHDSIRSFLTSDLIKESKVAFFALNAEVCHRKILRKCITYLSFKEFAKGRVNQEHDANWRVKCYPFVRYAALFWPIHAELTILTPEDEQIILSFFATKRQVKGGCFDSCVQFLIPDANEESITQTEPLYYAASYSMLPILKLLLRPENNVNIEQRGGRFGSTPLFVACYRENIEAARLLFEAGADADSLDISGTTCRGMAEMIGNDELVALMETYGLET